MQFHNVKEKVLIIDFGSQVTKLIARRVRDLGIFSEIITPKEIKRVKDFNSIRGIILSGGPSTVTKEKFERVPIEIFSKKIPILGICYGLQLIAKLYGGKIKSSKRKRQSSYYRFWLTSYKINRKTNKRARCVFRNYYS